MTRRWHRPVRCGPALLFPRTACPAPATLAFAAAAARPAPRSHASRCTPTGASLSENTASFKMSFPLHPRRLVPVLLDACCDPIGMRHPCARTPPARVRFHAETRTWVCAYGWLPSAVANTLLMAQKGVRACAYTFILLPTECYRASVTPTRLLPCTSLAPRGTPQLPAAARRRPRAPRSHPVKAPEPAHTPGPAAPRARPGGRRTVMSAARRGATAALATLVHDPACQPVAQPAPGPAPAGTIALAVARVALPARSWRTRRIGGRAPAACGCPRPPSPSPRLNLCSCTRLRLSLCSRIRG